MRKGRQIALPIDRVMTFPMGRKLAHSPLLLLAIVAAGCSGSFDDAKVAWSPEPS
jgi:hypothetical protein